MQCLIQDWILIQEKKKKYFCDDKELLYLELVLDTSTRSMMLGFLILLNTLWLGNRKVLILGNMHSGIYR